jgi:hypothetical protein
VAGFLKKLGASPSLAHRVASSGKGWWRLSLTRPSHQAMSADWFGIQGLKPLVLKYDSFKHETKPPYTNKYVRWCGRTGPRGPSYPIPHWVRSQPRQIGRTPLFPFSSARKSDLPSHQSDGCPTKPKNVLPCEVRQALAVKAGGKMHFIWAT